jgi:hypothetical protein
MGADLFREKFVEFMSHLKTINNNEACSTLHKFTSTK